MKNRWGKIRPITMIEAMEIAITYRMRRGMDFLYPYEYDGIIFVDRRRLRRQWRKTIRKRNRAASVARTFSASDRAAATARTGAVRNQRLLLQYLR